jgi:hypothetical protein
LALIPKNLYRGQPGTTDGTLATVPANKRWMVKEIIICNTTGTAATATLAVVESGGASAANRRILNAKSIPANDLLVLALATAMAAGDFISGLQGTAAALTLTISGVEQDV